MSIFPEVLPGKMAPGMGFEPMWRQAPPVVF